MSLIPTEKTKPKTNLMDHVIFLYGIPKIGKSTLVSEIEDVLFFNTGGGLDALECYQTPIPDWSTFLEACAEFVKGEHKYKVIAIDTIDRLHKQCVSYLMDKHKVQHPSDLEWGKGYDMVKDELMRPLTKLALSQYGLVLISHVDEKEIKTRTATITRSCPTLQGYIWVMIDGLTGVIMFMTAIQDKDGYRRIIRTTPNESYIAGDRTKRLASFGDIEILKDRPNWKRIEEIFNNYQEKGAETK
jgi:hypothetical protein